MVKVALVSLLIWLPFRNQVYELPPDAVSTIDPPAHIDPVDGEIVPEGEFAKDITATFNAGLLHGPCLMIALYVPGSVTVKVALVSLAISLPFLNHVYEVPPVAVKTKAPSSQIVLAAGEMVPVGTGSTIIIEEFEDGPLQSPWWIVVVYVPAWVTVIVEPVSPAISLPFKNQVYELPPVAVSTCDAPGQIEAVAGEMLPVGKGITVTSDVLEACPMQSPC